MIDLKVKNNNYPTVGEVKKQDNKPKYPYGLKITLNEKVLKKLGFGTEDFEVGESVQFKVNGKITELSKNQNDDYGDKERIEIQLTAIDLKPTDIRVKAQKIIEGG